MKFKFKLENVLKHRQILENLAEKDFREVEAELRNEERTLREMRLQITEARKHSFSAQTGGGKLAGTFRQVDDFIRLQDLRIERQLKKVQEIEKRVENLREILRLKAIDTKIIETLKDRRQIEFKKGQAKLEQKEIDEMVTMRYARK